MNRKKELEKQRRDGTYEYLIEVHLYSIVFVKPMSDSNSFSLSGMVPAYTKYVI